MLRRMNPQDLTDREALALLCLVRQLVVADGVVTVAELAQMHELGSRLGTEKYARLADAVEGIPATMDAALEVAQGVTRHEAQLLIRSLLVDLAAADGLDDTEADVIDLITEVWT